MPTRAATNADLDPNPPPPAARRVRGHTDAQNSAKRSPVKSSAASSAVTEARRRSSIPSRPVIEHTALLRAELQAQRSVTLDALASADMGLEVEAGIRDAAAEAAERAYDLALTAASNVRSNSMAIATERFRAARAELDAERADIIRAMEGIEAALAATEPKANIVQLHSETAE